MGEKGVWISGYRYTAGDKAGVIRSLKFERGSIEAAVNFDEHQMSFNNNQYIYDYKQSQLLSDKTPITEGEYHDEGYRMDWDQFIWYDDLPDHGLMRGRWGSGPYQYLGRWHNKKFNGIGILRRVFDKRGIVISYGERVNDELIGIGALWNIASTGEVGIWVGEFVSDGRHGRGIEISGHQMRTGEWKDDEFVPGDHSAAAFTINLPADARIWRQSQREPQRALLSDTAISMESEPLEDLEPLSTSPGWIPDIYLALFSTVFMGIISVICSYIVCTR